MPLCLKSRCPYYGKRKNPLTGRKCYYEALGCPLGWIDYILSAIKTIIAIRKWEFAEKEKVRS